MVTILVGYLNISENPAVIDGIPNKPDSQPVTTPAGPPVTNTSQTSLPALKNSVNNMAGPKYDFVVSVRLGRMASKEQYAYFFNTQTIQQIGIPYI